MSGSKRAENAANVEAISRKRDRVTDDRNRAEAGWRNAMETKHGRFAIWSFLGAMGMRGSALADEDRTTLILATRQRVAVELDGILKSACPEQRARMISENEEGF
jgi:hypothetical protein